MGARVFLLTPPFTQLNTPYPATAYLKGFLNTKQIRSFQADLGIEVTLRIFSRKGLEHLFGHIEQNIGKLSPNTRRIYDLREGYLQTIDEVVSFLQGGKATLAHLICKREFLPEADRFAQLDNLDWAFGTMGVMDKAKHLCTLYLEDLSDLIKEAADDHFGFSRYAERLGRSAGTFDELYESLHGEPTYTDKILFGLLRDGMDRVQPELVAISIPFPGNLYSALRCGQMIRQHYPGVSIVMGGGFVNTELRSLSDVRVFDFVDFIAFDDGEAPLELIIRYLDSNRQVPEFKRTMRLEEGKIRYWDNAKCGDHKFSATGTPDYSDLLLDQYISAIEIVNPMHRLWSDGRWNKLTMAHGCYWGKCTFCDVSLDYIRVYEPLAASLICDRMEEMIRQTSENGFHFVDEAAPPALMRALAIEILRRGLTVSWWTNIRFEKSFTRDLCLLLKASGCIAVSGGLEVASDRLLTLIQKGITVSQVAVVTNNFTDAGIMVHAYLMYGFPSQTNQETIDSLEMVRQMFKAGIIQSAFWHLFTMTAHSPVGLDPIKFGVIRVNEVPGSFANNDLVHEDKTGGDHEEFGFGLRKSLLNFMHGIGLDDPLHKWFEPFPPELKLPKTSISPTFIAESLKAGEYLPFNPDAKIVWLGNLTGKEYFIQSKKGNSREMLTISFATKRHSRQITIPRPQGDWLIEMLTHLSVRQKKLVSLREIKSNYESAGLADFELFWDNKPMTTMYRIGLLRL